MAQFRKTETGGLEFLDVIWTPVPSYAADEIERLRAILTVARVELTNVQGSEDTVEKIDAALFGANEQEAPHSEKSSEK